MAATQKGHEWNMVLRININISLAFTFFPHIYDKYHCLWHLFYIGLWDCAVSHNAVCALSEPSCKEQEHCHTLLDFKCIFVTQNICLFVWKQTATSWKSSIKICNWICSLYLYCILKESFFCYGTKNVYGSTEMMMIMAKFVCFGPWNDMLDKLLKLL